MYTPIASGRTGVTPFTSNEVVGRGRATSLALPHSSLPSRLLLVANQVLTIPQICGIIFV